MNCVACALAPDESSSIAARPNSHAIGMDFLSDVISAQKHDLRRV